MSCAAVRSIGNSPETCDAIAELLNRITSEGMYPLVLLAAAIPLISTRLDATLLNRALLMSAWIVWMWKPKSSYSPPIASTKRTIAYSHVSSVPVNWSV